MRTEWTPEQVSASGPQLVSYGTAARIGRLMLEWAGDVDPERFIEALGDSSVPEACDCIGSAMRDRDGSGH